MNKPVINIENYLVCTFCMAKGSKNLTHIRDEYFYIKRLRRKVPYSIWKCTICHNINFLNLETVALFEKTKQ